MPKIKVPKSAPSIDMTPMVDLAFLLVTFFMLTASFRMAEPVVVDPPSSVSDKLLPDNTILVTIDEAGRPFFGISNGEAKVATLKVMSDKYKVKFTEEQIKKFGGLSSFGVEIKDLPKYLNSTEAERLKFQPQKGIPNDSALNPQLRDWILTAAREVNAIYIRERDKAKDAGKEFKGEKPRYAIKADGKAKYVSVKDIIKTFTDMKIYRFNLITSLEGGASTAPAAGAH
ncbi:MAG TPA: biopolymer transporter ExbD [Bacteroidia bacterium]|jgi:biopolymer transport protein ExbD|nr:biopolymer transporter ExbD [Bacteroidia bacterium]